MTIRPAHIPERDWQHMSWHARARAAKTWGTDDDPTDLPEGGPNRTTCGCGRSKVHNANVCSTCARLNHHRADDTERSTNIRDQRAQKIRELATQRLTDRQIADRLHIDRRTVQRIRKDYKIPTRNPDLRPRRKDAA